MMTQIQNQSYVKSKKELKKEEKARENATKKKNVR